jgi:hypothetical protein
MNERSGVDHESTFTMTPSRVNVALFSLLAVVFFGKVHLCTTLLATPGFPGVRRAAPAAADAPAGWDAARAVDAAGWRTGGVLSTGGRRARALRVAGGGAFAVGCDLSEVGVRLHGERRRDDG